MSDQASFQEKTEAPTPRRREQARTEGQVPKSPELTTAVMLLAASAVIAVGAGRLASSMGTMLQQMAAAAAAPPETVGGATHLLSQLGTQVGGAVTPLLLALAATALAVAGMQARGVLTTKPLAPKLERISPASNIKRLFGVRAVADLLKSLLKLVVIGAVLYPVVSGTLAEAGELAMKPAVGLAVELQRRAVKLLLVAGLAYLAVALADYLYQVWQHERQMKMSKEEVKREHKEQEGDGMLKARRRSMARQRSRNRMFSEIPAADVVITNPTHIAVALRYAPEKVAAPVIVAMGERKVAQRIKALAYESGVPVMENKPLARALLATGRVGEPIPTELYVAVAEVLAFVIRQRGRVGFSEVVS